MEDPMSGYLRRRREHRTATWKSLAAAIFILAWDAFASLFQYGLKWPVLTAFGAALGCGLAVTAIALAVRASWPRPVPPELADEYRAWQAAGWHAARVHPWWHCDTTGKPHVHLVARGQRRTVLQVGRAAQS
jgi:hypothetical protein